MIRPIVKKSEELCLSLGRLMGAVLSTAVFFGKVPKGFTGRALILFPFRPATLCCGLAGIISFRRKIGTVGEFSVAELLDLTTVMEKSGFSDFDGKKSFAEHYLGGGARIRELLEKIRILKREQAFVGIFRDEAIQGRLAGITARVEKIVQTETAILAKRVGELDTADTEVVLRRIEDLKDAAWFLRWEVQGNIERVRYLMDAAGVQETDQAIGIYRELNAVLNSVDRLEVRGRDSAGISLLFVVDGPVYAEFQQRVAGLETGAALEARAAQPVLMNRSVSVRESVTKEGGLRVTLTLVYKIAAEIGHLGDNIRFLRRQIREDRILAVLAGLPIIHRSIIAHTRWASVGAITEPNCHPVDNRVAEKKPSGSGTIHVCLNGDIDNYLELKTAFEKTSGELQEEVTTDTKIIPLQIETHIRAGYSVPEAFRLAVNDFEGSHAISMHTDLLPGKLFLAQRGSGQAVFVGLAEDHYMPTSEVYGFVEETSDYLKLDGEKIIDGRKGKTQGQIFILDQASSGKLDGITGFYYDGTPIELSERDIKHTEITSRDIDRQEYPHYFLKEISESPVSVEKTLQNRWKIRRDSGDQLAISLDESAVPVKIRQALQEDRIRRIFFVGQGTAGVAAKACADILGYYLDDPTIQIDAMKSSEMSGFRLGKSNRQDQLSDMLMVAITQSGTTTDTNRTVDMVRERGGHTLAIVNRRDSDITFKVDGVIYTSSGRDIEMSVASTKAFYSQIVAGAVLGLLLAEIKKRRGPDFITSEIQQLLALPVQMRKILSMKDTIEASANRLAVTKTYWAAVGSGPNKASADEIRIKLSELCYKTISTDYVEDKKHIDLSSEPLIIVCAAGTRGTVIGDIIKDTAIFQAHKALPVVIADEGEDRFAPYAADVFHVPIVGEHLSPIVNTLVGHLWGYYAALAIHDGSRFLHDAREDLKQTIEQFAATGLDVFEIVLEKTFREKIVEFYRAFRMKKQEKRLSSAMDIQKAADLTLLLKYLAGRLPVADFEIDFHVKGTALNMLNTLFSCLNDAINAMARPIDAIKHQAKTVTVGTSRISEKVEGILFNTLLTFGFKTAQLTNKNVLVLKNLQGVVEQIKGAILYRIDGLDKLGELTDETRIHVLKKEGVLAALPSRVEKDTLLKGTKRIIVRQGNVYIGKGRKDDRSIIVIPIISASSASPNLMEFLLLLHIGFKEQIPLGVKIKALGGKYEHIKNIVQENSVSWEDDCLEMVPTTDLFGLSAEKIGESIVSQRKADTRESSRQ
ncbi:MAG: SIS domain-containing protein [Thermodesulfobacteriota bacterium]